MPTIATGVTFRPDIGQAYSELDLMLARRGYVGGMLLPRIAMPADAGTYPKVSKESLKSKVVLNKLRRGPNGTYNRDSFQVGSDNFTTEEYGWEEAVDERQAKILRRVGLDAVQVAADRCVDKCLQAVEQGVAAIVQDATTYSTQTTAVGTEWSDYPNAAPITDVNAAIERFEARNLGVTPNVLVVNRKIARNLLLCEQVASKLGLRPSEGLANEALQGNLAARTLEAVLGVPKVLIADGFKNANNQGIDASGSRIWSDEYASLLYVAGSPDLASGVRFGAAFAWSEEGGGDVVIEEYDEPNARGHVVRARFDLQLKVIHSELIEILSNITA